MFQPRLTYTRADLSDADGIKLYCISAHGAALDEAPFRARLLEMKQQWTVDWQATPAFAIFHDGAQARYLVLCHWGNDNELFTDVSVHTGAGWVNDRHLYSFCLWDMDVMWEERQLFIDTLYCDAPSLQRYRASRPARWL